MQNSDAFGSDRFQIEYRPPKGVWMPLTTPMGWFKHLRNSKIVQEYFTDQALGLTNIDQIVNLRFQLQELHPHHDFRIVKLEVLYHGQSPE